MMFCVFLMIQNIVILIMNIKTGYFLARQSATLSADLLLRKFIVVVIVFFLHIFFLFTNVCLPVLFWFNNALRATVLVKLYARRFNRFGFKSQKNNELQLQRE